jgi:hypothetical protein
MREIGLPSPMVSRAHQPRALLLLCDTEQTIKDVERMHEEDRESRSSAMPELWRGDAELYLVLAKIHPAATAPSLPSAQTSDSIHHKGHISRGKNLTGYTKGGAQWETKAAKRTKRKARNRNR